MCVYTYIFIYTYTHYDIETHVFLYFDLRGFVFYGWWLLSDFALPEQQDHDGITLGSQQDHVGVVSGSQWDHVTTCDPVVISS